MDKQNNQNQMTEHAEMGAYLEEVALKLISKGEALRGIAQLWFETNSEEFQITVELGMEITQLGRNLKLLEDCLCSNCQMKSVKTGILVGKAEGK